MQPGALKSLEFDRIVEAVKTFALTPMGSERLGRLQPSTDPQTVADLLAHTTETARFLTANGALPLRASTDLPDILAALGVEGRPLEALRLLALATFLESVDETRTAIRRAPGSFPRLEAIIGGGASFKGEIASTRDKIDPSGDVVDHASPELKIIRRPLSHVLVAFTISMPTESPPVKSMVTSSIPEFCRTLVVLPHQAPGL